MAIFLELHKPQPGVQSGVARQPHYHVALQATRSFRFLPMKRATGSCEKKSRRLSARHVSCTPLYPQV